MSEQADVKCDKCPEMAIDHNYNGCMDRGCRCERSEVDLLRAAYAASEAALAEAQERIKSNDALYQKVYDLHADQIAEALKWMDRFEDAITNEGVSGVVVPDNILARIVVLARGGAEARAEVERLRADLRVTTELLDGSVEDRNTLREEVERLRAHVCTDNTETLNHALARIAKLEAALREILTDVACDCDEAWTGRGLHESHGNCRPEIAHDIRAVLREEVKGK